MSTFIRLAVQVVLENVSVTEVKTVEVLDSGCNPDAEIVSPAILQALGDLPLIQVV